MKDFLGIVGGLGPLATTYFMQKIIKLTRAKKDQDHINMMVLNHATIPDRTAYILDSTFRSPYPDLLEDCRFLEEAGAKAIVIPCNTSHCFWQELQKEITVPIFNLQHETVRYLTQIGANKVGVLATTGTIRAELFQRVLNDQGIEFCLPNDLQQEQIMSVIYGEVKSGLKPSREKFEAVTNWLFADGCQKIVLGCTELSILKDMILLDERFVDTLDVVVSAIISLFGKECNNPQGAC